MWPARERAMIIVGMYSLWILGNKRRHGEQVMPLRIIVQWAIDTSNKVIGSKEDTLSLDKTITRMVEMQCGWSLLCK
jgi:hypothetical protein